ncbi:hypothetical protein V495_03438 [Pseudogymnoascus sp. VKM F-4514 (FW-929)]|nr:hypothetical protein V495_03438 [Pseudogymnoascus sp. VKM F-4514 (FW-929)]KFY55631.1 hypothetical protein V497_06844 [Pseudogymnoascus sp. VKM F-4516 (FW-969)]
MVSSIIAKAAIVAIGAASLVSAEGEWLSAIKDCPQACSSTGVNPGNWTAYYNTKKLARCKEPMLLDFLINNPIDDPDRQLKLLACSGTVTADDSTCDVGSESDVEVQSAWSGNYNGADAGAVVQAAEHTVSHLSKADCSSTKPTISFGYLNGSFVGVYSGGMMHNQGAVSLVKQFIADIEKDGPKGDFQVMQICGANRTEDYTIGIAASIASTPGDLSALAAVQKAVVGWSKAECAEGFGSSLKTNTKVLQQRVSTLPARNLIDARGNLAGRAECKTTTVAQNDDCTKLAGKCGITPAAFTALHKDDPKLCGSLQAGQKVCCTTGTLPDLKPKPNADGSCHVYVVQADDTCKKLAIAYQLTEEAIEGFNKETWGWPGCGDMQRESSICLSTGEPPFPAPVGGNVCGPQVPGTKKPAKGIKYATLNPCPLNACCNIWGQCGIDADFCTITKSESGAPGTAKKHTNGCISNCGTDIVKGTAPKELISLGYYEAFNSERKCLNMDVRSLNGYSFNVIHFAFADISDDFDVDVSAAQQSFDHFKAMTGFKKIISFGGWSFSTSLDSYAIFRQGVTDAQRQLFANNVAKFVKANNLDGADFDWEYPGAPDVGVPGVPPGSKEDGPNYLSFLKTMKGLMPDGKTVSIAAPASYYYLKGFPIKDISKVVDYIVYMTYDLHGQWDYDNPWSNPGCDDGNCLRSHVNSTETDLALSMITKAGVDSGKIVVGVSSYGRSFEMKDPSCTGPHCLFTGPLSGATAGECTDTPGYISNAEMNDIIGLAATTGKGKRDGKDVKTWHDESSDSDMMVWGNTWVAYMSDSTLKSRLEKYIGNNFAGSTNWAVDLKEFLTKYDEDNPDSGNRDWKHKYCTDDNTDINNSGKFMWDNVGTSDAFDAAVKHWKSLDGKADKQQFSQVIASFFNATDLSLSMDCNALNTANGCGVGGSVKCSGAPAGWIILNSMINLSAQYVELYNSIETASDDAWDDISNIGKTFNPPPSTDETAQLILDIATNVWSMAVAPGLGKVLTKAFDGDADKAYDKVTEAADVGLDKIGEALDPEELDGEATIPDQLKNMTASWLKGMDALNLATFDGKDESITRLKSLIGTGGFVHAQGKGAYEMKKHTEEPIYARLIPMSWSDDQGDKPRNPSGVFVLDSETACKAGDGCPDQVPGFPSGGLSTYMTTDAAQKTCHCYKDNMYYLVQLFGLAYEPAVYPSTSDERNLFTTPPGLDDLDGTKWAKLTLAKFVEGSVNTYNANDKKNGYKPDFKDPKTMGLFGNDGILAPGGIQIPVCSASEAFHNWNKVYNDEPKTPNYPCN